MEIIVLYLVLLAGAFFLLVVRPQRRQMAARRALIESIQVGDDVITAGGIYGTVRAMGDRTIELEVADGVALTLAREAVTGRPAPPAPVETESATESETDDEAGA